MQHQFKTELKIIMQAQKCRRNGADYGRNLRRKCGASRPQRVAWVTTTGTPQSGVGSQLCHSCSRTSVLSRKQQRQTSVWRFIYIYIFIYFAYCQLYLSFAGGLWSEASWLVVTKHFFTTPQQLFLDFIKRVSYVMQRFKPPQPRPPTNTKVKTIIRGETVYKAKLECNVLQLHGLCFLPADWTMRTVEITAEIIPHFLSIDWCMVTSLFSKGV